MMKATQEMGSKSKMSEDTTKNKIKVQSISHHLREKHLRDNVYLERL